MAADLFTPIRLGGLELPNCIVMAPLTRNRAGQPGNVPQLQKDAPALGMHRICHPLPAGHLRRAVNTGGAGVPVRHIGYR